MMVARGSVFRNREPRSFSITGANDTEDEPEAVLRYNHPELRSTDIEFLAKDHGGDDQEAIRFKYSTTTSDVPSDPDCPEKLQ